MLLAAGDDAGSAEWARQYLHLNCAHCHVPDGGGNAKMVLSLDTALPQTNLIDQPPMHGAMGIKGGQLVAAGRAAHSVLAYRLASLGGGRMPRVGSHAVDVQGLKLIREWIAELGAADDALTQPTSDADQGLLAALNRLRQGQADTSDALKVVFAIDDQALPELEAKELIERGATHVEPAIRDLFERFLPESRRAPRLGADPDPRSILALAGDAAQGERLFHQSQTLACRSCHRIAGKGRSVGPDLDGVGKKNTRPQLLQHVLDPSAVIADVHASYLVETSAGRVLAGLLLQRDDRALKIQDAAGEIHFLPMNEVERLQRQQKSLMPDQLLKDLTPQQAADLLDYLKSLD